MNCKIVIITGVSGSGKSTIGKEIALSHHFEFLDADAFHPKDNIDKMSKGIALNDDDRAPWIKNMNYVLKEKSASHSVVLTCSCLKESYRDSLIEGISSADIIWIHLHGSYELIRDRIESRGDHFMSAQLLQSQFDTYEQPKNGLFIDISLSIQQIANLINSEINKSGFSQMEVRKSEVGLIGLGVMGLSLARNIASKGHTISLFNRFVIHKEEQVAAKATERYKELHEALAFEDIHDFVLSLSSPRKIILMVNAGQAVDDVIQTLIPFLDKGDVILDGGNSYYKDTVKRQSNCENQGIYFMGSGVSGGEEGALKGPSIMPGGAHEAYLIMQPILSSIAAKSKSGDVCCGYIGGGGAGHFVKMVHNGIEYAEMQIICEVYSHLRYDMKYSPSEIAGIFSKWNSGRLGSYLLEITIDILQTMTKDGKLLLDLIEDKAGNKGTGSWTTTIASELGVPLPIISSALFARYFSSNLDQRKKLSIDFFSNSNLEFSTKLEDLESAYYFSRIMNHLEGFSLINEASKVYNWQISMSELLRTWSGGCIIRSELLALFQKITLDQSDHLLVHPLIKDFINQNIEKMNALVGSLCLSSQSYPCFTSALQAYKYQVLTECNANLIQAQRDYFGAHTFKYKDEPDGDSHHYQWY